MVEKDQISGNFYFFEAFVFSDFETMILMLMIVYDRVHVYVYRWYESRDFAGTGFVFILCAGLALLVTLLLSHSRRCKLSVWAGPLI